ncbi:diguanylate cyclase (GGDEF) domain-containing protein [Shewanella psychrophila]|uniref:diguanylate cyclase n=1 Tax=Shewanella psychrophila TaxID=225848 RepID=A0A1S6HK88_9GAMM|nr:GGDEF domain-containing protein [Shewanella psychrophila]AQS35923.1 diguanylate cyclase (GGDEF) domain-containing protein [Shewanella psychrophila]
MSLFSFALFRSALFRVFFPLLLAVQLCLSSESLLILLSPYQNLISTFPYIMLSVVIFLSQPFNQGATGLVALLMVVSLYLIQNYVGIDDLTDIQRFTFCLLVFALPVNLFLIHFLPEKRLLSRFGINYLLFILFQVVWCWLLLEQLTNENVSWLWSAYLKPLPSLSSSPLLLIIISMALTLVSGFIVLFRNSNFDHTIFINLVFCTLALVFFDTPAIPAICFSLAATLLLLSIITSSHELAFIDQLTELQGRRALEIEMEHINGLYTIAMLDVDHFKQFNDSYGHRTGDEVLRLVAQIMKQTEGNASVFRYGGEEFIILFKGKNSNQCLPYLNELRSKIANYDLVIRDHHERPILDKDAKIYSQDVGEHKTVNITVSIGVADSINARTKRHDLGTDEVFKAADKALYRAKSGGRNRVTNLRFA